VYRALCLHAGLPHEPVVSLSKLSKELTTRGPLTLVAATDGNHGRAVARMARLLNVGAHILVPEGMAKVRIGSIREEGARVTVVAGTYDDAVVRSASQADERNLVISDTSWPGYDRVPTWVVEGYSTIGWEINEKLSELDAPMPNVVSVQIGVGALAAAIARHFGSVARIIGVEPLDAACALASVEADAIVDVPGPHRSIMAGLNCGRVSLVAWPVISRVIDTFLAVSDADAREAMRVLADAGIISGESGAAGLAGLLAFRDELHLDPNSSALIVSTEGATDPEEYARVVGGSTSKTERF
jgi:diaminopropionate ammonia-lyase